MERSFILISFLVLRRGRRDVRVVVLETFIYSMRKMTSDDDVPQLSAETLKALQEFLEEQAHQKEENVSENWQLSQFWYDEHTTSVLSSTVLSQCQNHSNIALISCPTLYPDIKSKVAQSNKEIKVILFEYDKRFARYDPDFEFYDFNEPLNINSKYNKCFDIVVIDPPFLSEECLTKTVKTVDLIRKEESKIILCTGAVMEELGSKLLNIKKVSFEPKHKNNLGNEFICMTNFGEISEEISQKVVN